MSWASLARLGWPITVSLFALALTPAWPVLAHGLLTQGELDSVVDNLLVTFGLPLVVLLIGALAGAGLSAWLSKREAAADDLDDALEPAERDDALPRDA